MKANDTSLRVFLEGGKQFVVPLFQRTYSWKRANVRRLWDDLCGATDDRREDPEATHFFGSFVTMPIPSSASKVSRFVIIDGQQRLVTTFVLLAAIRNRVIELAPHSDKKDEINETYLKNKFDKDHRYKVLPTQADRRVFFQIVDAPGPMTDGQHPISAAHRFFARQLASVGSLDELVALEDTILSGFSVVDIRLESSDDEYLIFESLNATGTALTQADLIRNYLFMKIAQDGQQRVYDTIWFPMQQDLGDSLQDFIRHYLAMDGDIPTFSKIYATFRVRVDQRADNEAGIVDSMKELARYAQYYRRFLKPETEEDSRLRALFGAFTRLDTTTPYPLMLSLYDDYVHGRVTRDELADCLKAIETYVVRRAVCRVPAQALNKYFPTLVSSLDSSEIADSLKDTLAAATGARMMPGDEEFRRSLCQRPLLDRRIVRYLLEEIERFDNKEVVDLQSLQVEHIMPKQLSTEWRQGLGSDWELVHRTYLDTLGNLTLTGYNPEYSNKPFCEKRDMTKGFRQSGLRLNRALADIEEWTQEQIRERARQLSEIALNIWAV